MKIADKFAHLREIPYDTLRVQFHSQRLTIEFIAHDEVVATEERPLADADGFVLDHVGLLTHEVG